MSCEEQRAYLLYKLRFFYFVQKQSNTCGRYYIAQDGYGAGWTIENAYAYANANANAYAIS